MSFLDAFFGRKQTSANVARNRLSVILATERGSNALPYMDDLKRDILEVLKKYTQVKDIKIKAEQNQNIEMLEVEITLSK
jgi:cell division topological specificity factor